MDRTKVRELQDSRQWSLHNNTNYNRLQWDNNAQSRIINVKALESSLVPVPERVTCCCHLASSDHTSGPVQPGFRNQD